MPDPSVVVPLSLANLRRRAGVTVEALAAACAVTLRAAYSWERGESRMSAARVREVASALGLGDSDELALHRWAASVDPAIAAKGGE